MPPDTATLLVPLTPDAASIQMFDGDMIPVGRFLSSHVPVVIGLGHSRRCRFFTGKAGDELSGRPQNGVPKLPRTVKASESLPSPPIKSSVSTSGATVTPAK